MKVFKEILNKLTTRYGNRHLRIGTALHNVGVANLRAGNYGEAADAIEEAVLIRKKKLGKTHPKVADSLVELGTVLLSQREFVDAIEILSEALKIREGEEANVTEEEKGNVVIQQSKIINNIGCVHFEVGDMEKAKEFFERALKIQREGYANGWISSDPAYVAMSSIACNLGMFCK
jgi:tetratricopeptide (TPR) repeat protein